MPISARWKTQERCRMLLEALTGYEFRSIRPDWLKNPRTGRNLELDCYNDDLRLALEYSGAQHYVYPNKFHKDIDAFEGQVYRDTLKKKLCEMNNVSLIIVPHTISKYDLCSYIIQKLQRVRESRSKRNG